jgi:putative inorganic carbon (HCO3(-)) transporter
LGFFLTLLYVVIIFIRPQEFIGAMKAWPILDVMAVLCISALFLEGGFTSDTWRRSPLNQLMLWFWLALILSYLSVMSLWGARLAFTIFAKVEIVYFLIIFSVTTFRRLKVFTWALVLMGAFLALQSIWQYYTGVGIVGGTALHRGELMQARGIGIFQDPNDLALNIVCFIPFVLPHFHKYMLSRSWLPGILLLIPMTTGVIYTRSRGGILGLAAVFWYYFHRRVGMVLSIGVLLLMLSVVATLPRFGSTSVEDASTRTRMEHWANGLNLFRQRPIFGIGIRQFVEHQGQTAHNSFILALAEAGFVGAFFWIALFLQGFRELFLMGKLPNAPPWLAPFLAGLTGSLIGWQVCAFFLSQTYNFTSYILLALVVATLNVLNNEGYSVRHPWSARMTLLNFVATVAAIIGMHILLRILWGMVK